MSSVKENLTADFFYPDGLVYCPNDLDIEDGTYEIPNPIGHTEGCIKDVFVIKNRRIQTHCRYNISKNIRLMMWRFEYLNIDGNTVNNIWRYPDHNNPDVGDLFSSTHWEYYPKEYEARVAFDKAGSEAYDKMIDQLLYRQQNRINL